MYKMHINNKEFDLIKMIGKGKGGYSYLVSDNNKQYVLKQIHHEPCNFYHFKDKIQSEINDYNKLLKLNIRMPKMLEYDIKLERILKEYIEGETIFEKVENNDMKETYITQIKDMCKILYKNNTNIDYFPTNFVVNHDLIYYVDYECNDYMKEWDFENWGVKYWSRTKEFTEYVKNNM